MIAKISVATAAGDQRPNILLILSDDQSWTDYSFMGHPHVETPTLDKLAAESLTFTRGYVTTPLCRPSLASILTGLPTHMHGITGNDPATGDKSIRNMASRSYPRHNPTHQVLYDRFKKLPNVARKLQQAGYATMQTGKWWEANPEEYGFDHAMTHGDPARGARHGDDGLKISREGIEPIREFLDEVGGKHGSEAKPFFIWHAPFLPHTPHNPPKELLAKYEGSAPSKPVARYWAMCEWFDQTCGHLLNELDSRALSQSTVVIYITDNGWIQHPKIPNMFAPRSKTTAYEGGIRTPLMLRWPAHVEPQLDTGTLVSAIDIAPTILNLAGLGGSTSLPGIDLLDTSALENRAAIFGSNHPHDIADVRSPNEKLQSRFIVKGPWKLLAHSRPKVRNELFHLEADPHEKTDLASQRPEKVAELVRDLNAWWDGSPE